ncbi:hypothetical protein GCK32_017265, partial [Trichostrongylus colubriformis]
GSFCTVMKISHCLALLFVLFAVASSLKTRKPKKESVYVKLPPDVLGGEPRYVKAPKIMTEYDKCKMECKRQRDASHRKENIAALREELAILEAQEAAEAATAEPSSIHLQEGIDQDTEIAPPQHVNFGDVTQLEFRTTHPLS